MAFDDPIVYPGQPGKSHLHAFFGNTGLDANSTATSIATAGNSTCRGGTINRSGYWVPAMIDTGDGAPVRPSTLIVYYKTGYRGVKAADVRPFPPGLRMIAGNPNAVGPGNVNDPIAHYTCNGNNPWTFEIPNCAPGTSVWATILFPQCWDGVNIDSPDHRSHMTYSIPGKGCPATHPVPLPEVAFNLLYAVTAANQPTRWRLASDTYNKSQPGGYSFHGDWFGGWKRDILQTWVKNCDDASVDCFAHLLGDGRMMY